MSKFLQRVVSRFLPMERKQTSRPLWPTNWAGQQVSWTVGDYEAYAQDGFTINSLIYSAVSYKVRAQQASPLRAWVGDPDSPKRAPPEHPLSVLIKRPNPYQSWAVFHGLNTVYLNISGNVFNLLVRDRKDDLPSVMRTLRPDCVKIIPDSKKGVMGYLWVPPGVPFRDGIPILPEDMIHIKLSNPLDPLDGLGFGLSPLAAAAYSADVDNLVTKFLMAFFKYAAIPAGVLKFDRRIDEDELAVIRRRWQDRYGGAEHWTEVGVLDSGASYERVGLTFREMGFAELDERNESRVLGPLGVPAILLSTRLGLSRSTYSNLEQAKQIFWQDTFRPENELYASEYNMRLKTDDDAFVGFDYSEVPALQVSIPPMVAAAYQLWSMGVPANTAFRQVGLRDMPKISTGDQGFLPPGLVPAERLLEEPEPAPVPQLPPGAEAPPEDGEEESPTTEDSGTQSEVKPPDEESAEAPTKSTKMLKLAPHTKMIVWKAVDRTAQSWEPAFAKLAGASLLMDRNNLLAAVTDAHKKSLEQKATVDWEEVGGAWEGILAAAGDHWREAFIPAINGVINDQGEHLALTFGFQFDVRNMEGEKWFQQYALTFAQPINDVTAKDVHHIIELGMRDGWSVPQMQKNMTTLFQQYIAGDVDPDELSWFEDRLPPYRTEMIARTETMRASNAGSDELYKEWGVEEHEWLATADSRTRPEHTEANGQVRKINEPFDVGGEELAYPGDPNGSPENTINCRCTVLPVMEEG